MLFYYQIVCDSVTYTLKQLLKPVEASVPAQVHDFCDV